MLEFTLPVDLPADFPADYELQNSMNDFNTDMMSYTNFDPPHNLFEQQETSIWKIYSNSMSEETKQQQSRLLNFKWRLENKGVKSFHEHQIRKQHQQIQQQIQQQIPQMRIPNIPNQTVAEPQESYRQHPQHPQHPHQLRDPQRQQQHPNTIENFYFNQFPNEQMPMPLPVQVQPHTEPEPEPEPEPVNFLEDILNGIELNDQSFQLDNIPLAFNALEDPVIDSRSASVLGEDSDSLGASAGSRPQSTSPESYAFEPLQMYNFLDNTDFLSPLVNTVHKPVEMGVSKQQRKKRPQQPTQQVPKVEQKSKSQENLQCSNCATFTTPLWRRDEEGNAMCNACGLFYKLHGMKRPLKLKTDVIKRRNRQNTDEYIPQPSRRRSKRRLEMLERKRLQPIAPSSRQ